MTDTNSTLIVSLDQLKESRELAIAARAAKAAILKEVTESEKYKRAEQTAKDADEAVAQLETAIRQYALELDDQGDALPERIEVKSFKVVSYDEKRALAWALHNFTPALKLDTKLFEKAAIGGTIPDDLATITTEKRAQIATKL